jgi:hypothetical protein
MLNFTYSCFNHSFYCNIWSRYSIILAHVKWMHSPSSMPYFHKNFSFLFMDSVNYFFPTFNLFLIWDSTWSWWSITFRTYPSSFSCDIPSIRSFWIVIRMHLCWNSVYLSSLSSQCWHYNSVFKIKITKYDWLKKMSNRWVWINHCRLTGFKQFIRWF